MTPYLTVSERIILHLSQYSKYQDEYDVPSDVSQDGIALAIRISRAHAAIELKKLKESGEVIEKLSHIKRGKTKRKVYFLTSRGEERAQKIREFAEKEGIAIGPLLDLRKCKGEELWNATDAELRPILAQACVFRKPFRRSALPDTTVPILPMDEKGLVEIPQNIRQYIQKIVDPSDLKRYHSFAADYWLKEGDYKERLYHLINAGRKREVEMLITSRSKDLLANADEDLLSILNGIADPSKKYAGQIWLFIAEVARKTGHLEYAEKALNMLALQGNPQDVILGKIIQGRILLSKGDLNGALELLREARQRFGENDQNAELDCDIADALIGLGKLNEAREVLMKVISVKTKKQDPELLDRALYQLGVAYLKMGNGQDAIRYLSKSMGLAGSALSADILEALSEAYKILGMNEKSAEIVDKLQLIRKKGCPSIGQCR